MKKILLASLVSLLLVSCVFGQSTTISGQVTDSGGQTWNNGTVVATFVPNPQKPNPLTYSWTGGAFGIAQQTVTGVLGNGGAYSISVPSNTAISPVNTQWTITVTSQTSPPFSSSQTLVITGGSQTINFTPSAITLSCGSGAVAYADSEVQCQVGGSYYNLVSQVNRTCTAATGNVCSIWAASGGGGTGSTTNPTFPTGLLAWYRCMPTDTIASLKDYSGNNNNATGTVGGTPPTLLTGGGGCNFTGNGAISLPAFSSSVKTIQAVVGFQQSSNVNIFNGIVTSTGTALLLTMCSGTSCITELGSETSASILRGFISGIDDVKSRSIVNGIAVVTLTMRTVGNGGDFLYINKSRVCTSGGVVTDPVCPGSGISGQAIVTGNFQMGGGAVGVGGVGTQSYFTGQIYDLAFYSTDFDDATQAAGFQALATDATNRGITLGLGATDLGYQWIADGDSQTAGGGGVSIHYPAIILSSLNQAFGSINNGGQGTTAFVGSRLYPFQVATEFRVKSSGNIVTEYLGVNDCGQGQTGAQILQSKSTYHNGLRQLATANGFNVKTITMDHLSNTGFDACKNSANGQQRQHWTEYANWFIDIGASALGADGASANTTFFVDGLHPTQASQYNYLSPMVQRAINGILGNQNFTSATTYSSVAPAAVTITAASESVNTMTFTSAAGAPAVGKCVIVTGVTPAGYNSIADGCWYVITSNGTTTWTAFNNTTGLGVGTVFGTFQVPQQADADNFAILNFGVGNHTLQPCWQWGAGLNYTVKNINAAGSTIVPFSAETIDGGASITIAAKATVILQSVLTSASAAGCSWKQLQNN